METLYNVVSLSSEASAEVDNDLLSAVLAVQHEDKEPAVLADKVNASMVWAVNKLRPYSSLTIKTREYQTHPRYDTSQSRRLIGWRATQTLQIQTDDFESAGKAIQILQERLQVQSIQLSVKPETRRTASDNLINQALTSFKDRARLVQKNMGSAGFRILDIDIQSDQGGSPGYSMRAEMQDNLRSSAMVSQPAVEAGTSRVMVRVHGRVQLE